MKTRDGFRNSATPFENIDQILKQTIKKYRLMKFRMKISCIAYEKLKTVN